MKYNIDTLRGILTDTQILESFIQYMTSNQLDEFCEELVKDYDVEYFDSVTNFNDWYNEQSKTDRYHIEEVICDNCDYCAEPHQLNEDDMYECIDYTSIKKDLDNWFSIDIEMNYNFEEFCKGIMLEALECDPSYFYI